MSVYILGMPSKAKQEAIRDFLLPLKAKKIYMARKDGTLVALVVLPNSGDVEKAVKRSGEFCGGFKVCRSSRGTLRTLYCS